MLSYKVELEITRFVSFVSQPARVINKNQAVLFYDHVEHVKGQLRKASLFIS